MMKWNAFCILIDCVWLRVDLWILCGFYLWQENEFYCIKISKQIFWMQILINEGPLQFGSKGNNTSLPVTRMSRIKILQLLTKTKHAMQYQIPGTNIYLTSKQNLKVFTLIVVYRNTGWVCFFPSLSHHSSTYYFHFW